MCVDWNGNACGSEIVVIRLNDFKMHIANADQVAPTQVFVLHFFAVNEAAALTFVVLQKQLAVVLHNARVRLVHGAGVQHNGIALASPQRADVGCDWEEWAAVVLKAKLVHRGAMASVKSMKG